MIIVQSDWLQDQISKFQGRRKLPEGGAAALLDQSGDAANIEARKDENSARSVEKFFSPSFSVIRTGSRRTFVLYFED